jgi:hypothetical protein
VNQAALSIAATDVTKTYGQTPTLSLFSSSGLQNSETIGSVTLASAGTAATAGVLGGPYTITASAATGGTFDSSNYSISYTAGSLTVNQAALSITATGVTKTYGQTPTLSLFSSSGLQNSETIGSVTLASAGTSATAGVLGGPYTITASGATGGSFDAANYSISYNTGSLTVNTAALSITATGVTKTYGQTPTLSLFSSSGLQNSETIGSVTLASFGTAATASVLGGPYTITASGATGGTFDAANYSISYNTGSLTVNTAALSITATGVTKTYGQTPTLSLFSSSGLQNSETIGSVTLASAGTSATAGVLGGPYTITASAATGGTFDSSNYSISYNTGSLTVGKATLTVTTGATKTYDGNAYSGGAVSYSGFVNSEAASDLGGTLTYGGTAQGATNANTYSLTASGQSSDNYDIVYAPGSLVINKALLSLTATDVTKTYGQSLTLSAYTAAGLQNGETIGGVALTSSGSVATAGVGSSPYAISIANATGGTFSSANYDITYFLGALTVARATLTVTPGATKTYDGNAYSGGAVTYAGFVNSENATALAGTLTYGGTAQGATNANTYSLTATGQSSDNYDIVYASGSLIVGKAGLTVTALPASKVRDGVSYAGGGGVTYAGFVAGQGASQLGGLLGYGGTSQGAVTAGTYSLMPMGLTSDNYDITFLGALLTISPGGDKVDPIPYLLAPVKPKPFVVLTQLVMPTQPVALVVGGLNYIHVDAPKGAPASQPATAQSGDQSGSPGADSQSADSGGPIDASALPRSIKGPTDVFIIKGGLNVGEGVLISE